MAIQEKVDSSGKSYTQIYAGSPGSAVLAGTLTDAGLVLPEGDALEIPTATHGTSVQSPLVIAGNADAATARAGGTVRAPNVVGATTNVAGADLIVAPGLGHGSGTAGTTILKAPDAAASGNNAQTLATVATVAFGGITLAAGKTLSAPAVVGSTSTTTPKVIGGTGVGSDLVLQSTSGAGDGSDTVLVKVGNDGGTTAATFTATGLQGAVGVTTPAQLGATAVAVGTADGGTTARTGGAVHASDVATGGAGNVAGADLTIRPGKGTGTGTPGNVLLQAAPAAASGDNAQVPATVATISAGALTMAASTNLIVATKTPASAGAAGVAGTIAWDADYIYVCTATNTWERVAIASW